VTAAAYLRREMTTDQLTGARSIRVHVTVWDNGTRLDDVDLPDGTDAELHAMAAAALAPRWQVGEFIAPPWHRPLSAPDELDHRADVLPACRCRLFTGSAGA